MKINKLFHWLYAILLLLPIAIFLPTGIYYGFNEHAIAQEKTKQEPIYYETNEVNTLDDLIDGNVYTLQRASAVSGKIMCYDVFNIEEWTSTNVSENYPVPFILTTLQYTYVKLNNTSNPNGKYSITTNAVVYFVYREDILNDLSNYLTDNYKYISQCNVNIVKTYQEVTYSMSIVDSMQTAWQDTWQLPYFSWAGNSFLAEPFNYITVLFGIPDNSVFVYALSYWLSISIIWMVFDIVIYVPMLIHRWLDKASLS